MWCRCAIARGEAKCILKKLKQPHTQNTPVSSATRTNLNFHTKKCILDVLTLSLQSNKWNCGLVREVALHLFPKAVTTSYKRKVKTTPNLNSLFQPPKFPFNFRFCMLYIFTFTERKEKLFYYTWNFHFVMGSGNGGSARGFILQRNNLPESFRA